MTSLWKLLPLLLIIASITVVSSRMLLAQPTPTATITGTVTPADPSQGDIRTGAETIIITLTDATFSAGVETVGDAAHDGLINGISGGVGSEWDTEVKTALLTAAGAVVSETVVVEEAIFESAEIFGTSSEVLRAK